MKPASTDIYNIKCYMESINLISLKINFIYSSYNKVQSIYCFLTGSKSLSDS